MLPAATIPLMVPHQKPRLFNARLIRRIKAPGAICPFSPTGYSCSDSKYRGIRRIIVLWALFPLPLRTWSFPQFTTIPEDHCGRLSAYSAGSFASNLKSRPIWRIIVAPCFSVEQHPRKRCSNIRRIRMIVAVSSLCTRCPRS